MSASGVFKWAAAVLASSALAACGQTPAKPAEKLDPSLRAYVLGAVPNDIQHPTFFDFEGKVHLIGYDLASDSVAPGQDVKITFYWQSVSRLGPGWRLYTHVLDGAGVPVQGGNEDNVGALRKLEDSGKADEHQALGPSRWQPGKVYVDEQQFTLPEHVRSAEALISVGIWKDDLRLEVLSGPTDGQNGAIVARVKTGLPAPIRHRTTKPKS
jgi:hypothetical protein